ncbi:MAG TPA: hypothetical protein VK324_06605 [Tepidisphaeraceae bacterium]|nr:hypothetical protein [Tepidisphaeraceae bacterium]
MSRPAVDAYDVAVLGDHPCAYFAATLLRTGKRPLSVLHVPLGDDPGCHHPPDAVADRLVLVNPALFKLGKPLASFAKDDALAPVHGVRFVADDPATRSDHKSSGPLAYVARLSHLRSRFAAIAEAAGVTLVPGAEASIGRATPDGVEVCADGHTVRAAGLIVSGELSPAHRRTIGLPDAWDRDVLRRYTYAELPAARFADAVAKPLVTMSLNLGDTYHWAWAYGDGQTVHVGVEQPRESVDRKPSAQLLRHWMKVLAAHGQLREPTIDDADVRWRDVPFAGALAVDGVADRTLLVGPAGGFVTACAEDVYPACWSAVHAADTMAKALKEPLLQDALQSYRSRWRTTLGMYLQGPQQDLRFLLPMVYRNAVMTARLAESILTGKSVVR